MHGADETFLQNVVYNPRKESLLVRLGYRRKEHVKMNLEGIEFECNVWIQLSQAAITYCLLVNTIPERTDNFLTNRRRSAYQEILCSME